MKAVTLDPDSGPASKLPSQKRIDVPVRGGDRSEDNPNLEKRGGAVPIG